MSRFEVDDEVVFKSPKTGGQEHIGTLVGVVEGTPGYRNRFVLFSGEGSILLTPPFIESYKINECHKFSRGVELFEKEIFRLSTEMDGGGFHCFKCKYPNPYAESNFGKLYVCRSCRT